MTNDQIYIALRNFTDTWGLLLTMVTFVILVAWPFRPGASKVNDAAARMIFEEENDVQ